jgi:SAM-dependent methyltransferase
MASSSKKDHRKNSSGIKSEPAAVALATNQAAAQAEDYSELLIGCGSRANKDISIPGKEKFHHLVRLDYNADHHPDVLWDLRNHPLPFEDNTFNEVHAYEVLEHLAQQGDYRFFFAEFSEYWRILKPGGHFFATVPDYRSKWAWGDPSHTRVIQSESLVFLDQDEYTTQVGVTKMSDFRSIYKAHFKFRYGTTNGETLKFVLEAIKQ